MRGRENDIKDRGVCGQCSSSVNRMRHACFTPNFAVVRTFRKLTRSKDTFYDPKIGFYNFTVY